MGCLTTVGGDLYVDDNDVLCEDEVYELVAQLASLGGTVTNSDDNGTCP